MKNKLLNEQNYARIFHYFAMILFIGLFAFGLVYTGHNFFVKSEYVDIEFTHPINIIALVLFGWLFMYLVTTAYDKVLGKINENIYLAVFSVVSFAIAAYVGISTATLPQADALSLVEIAQNCELSNPEIYDIDSYICVYSNQLGFVTLLRILFKIFGNENYKAVHVFLSLNVPLIMISATAFVRAIFKDNKEKAAKASFMVQIFVLLCLPIYLYVPFIYGDLPYAALSMLAAYLLVSNLNEFSPLKALNFGIVSAVAYLLKSNFLIVAVAFIIVLVLSLFNKERRKAAASSLVSLLLCTILLPKLNSALYTAFLPKDYDSMPALCWVAMGMNDDGRRAGWCNFYNQIIFAESGYNKVEANRAALAQIKSVLGVWVHDLKYMGDFINRKLTLQWQAPMYQGVVMNNRFVTEEQFGFGKAIYESEALRTGLEHYMKGYQLTMYASVAAALVFLRKKKQNIAPYALLIAVFGGFFFSLIWETKTRYVFPYLVFIIPYFAIASVTLTDMWKNRQSISLSVDTPLLERDKSGYNGLDLFKFIMAFLVIAVHTIPHMYVENELAISAVKGLISTAVPFFFVTAGFLLGRKIYALSSDKERVAAITKYLKRMIFLYLAWSVVYLPLAISEYVSKKMTVLEALKDYFIKLIFVGEHYNSWILWYLLSTIFALLLLLLFTKLKIRPDTLAAFGFVLFTAALFFEWAWDNLICEEAYTKMFDVLRVTFYTGRSLKGIFYFPLGVVLAIRRPKPVTGIILAVTGYALALFDNFGEYPIALCSLGIFSFASGIRLKDSPVYYKLRKMSTVIYFTHMLVWTDYYSFVHAGEKHFGVNEFIGTSVITLAVAFIWVMWGEKLWRSVREKHNKS